MKWYNIEEFWLKCQRQEKLKQFLEN